MVLTRDNYTSNKRTPSRSRSKTRENSRNREYSRNRSHSNDNYRSRRREKDRNDRDRNRNDRRSRSRSRSPSSSSTHSSISFDQNNNNKNKNNKSQSNNNNNNNNNNKNNQNNNSSQSSNGEGFIKAVVTESNGEISCSIEETNRIRAALGLKPLAVNKLSKEAEAVNNFEEQQRKLDEKELKQKIEDAKNKRLLRQKLNGPTLSSIEAEAEVEELQSAAAWVQRSRRKENEEKSQQNQKKIEQELNDKKNKEKYDSKDLKGIAITHGIEDFETGEEVILTLADSSILNHDEDGKLLGLNEEGDILENVNIADKDRRLEREKRLKKSRQPVYTGYDDAEFAEGSIVGVKPSILPQYDKETKTGPKLVLGESGNAIISNENKESDENELNLIKRVPQSLQMEVKEMSEYLTPTEFATFNKPKKEKKKRKIRKKDSTSLIEELEASLEYNQEENGESTNGSLTSDRGKRGEGNSQLQKLHQEEINRRQAYDSAVKTAAQATSTAIASTPSTITTSSNISTSSLPSSSSSSTTTTQGRVNSNTNTQSTSQVNNFSLNDDDDAEIAESLARARRLALQLQQKEKAKEKEKENESLTLSIPESKENDGDDIGYEIAQKVRYVAQKFHPNQNINEKDEIIGLDDENILDAEGRKKDGTLVFTSTTEFTTRLQARLQEKARSRAEAAMKDVNESSGESDDEDNQDIGNYEEKSNKKPKRLIKRRKVQTTQKEQEKSGWVDLGNGDMEVVGEENGNNEDEDEYEYVEVSDDGDEGEVGKYDKEHDDDDDDDEVDDEQLGFLHKQPLVAKGMAATLQLLKGTGDLQTKEELAGRAKDARDRDPSSKENGIKIEYRDELGRKLTQKEAFRQLSYRFHGFGPGIKKREKRLREYEAAQKISSSRAGVVADKGTMKALTRAQEGTGKAYITVQGGLSSADSAAELAASVAKKAAKLNRGK